MPVCPMRAPASQSESRPGNFCSRLCKQTWVDCADGRGGAAWSRSLQRRAGLGFISSEPCRAPCELFKVSARWPSGFMEVSHQRDPSFPSEGPYCLSYSNACASPVSKRADRKLLVAKPACFFFFFLALAGNCTRGRCVAGAAGRPDTQLGVCCVLRL